ncbi:hypothetical protein Ddye_005922 [Dipteronia dyeriana]|uniref:Uncharacterized protein n=1 Tax=Dipteronia dyeriana TaxID=168575 RepID=A0AAD9XH70_9ROSI|nr:hypothetical protein Ddye_005922 [Dipteronia dyeriana]
MAAAFFCSKAKVPISYLGLPLGGNPRKESLWIPVLNKIKQILAPWKRGFMSKGGRLVLIKYVLSSLPTFCMSVFKIPVGLARKIEKMQRGFFGNDGIMKKKIHSVDWSTACYCKRKCGLGI